jgi:hypothetical protein
MRSGDTATGTVTLDGEALSGGAVVTIESSGSDARLDVSSVTVSAGSRTASFAIHAAGVSGNTEVLITATYAGVSKSVQIRVQPGVNRSLTVSVRGVVG